MAERSQINALVSSGVRDLLREEAKTRKCSQGELVEAALLAYCQPGTTSETEGLVFARLLAIEETLAQIMGTLQALVTIAEAYLKKPASPKIASYDEMYGPLTTQDALAEPAEEPALPDVAPADPLPSFPPPRGWRYWLRGKEPQ